MLRNEPRKGRCWPHFEAQDLLFVLKKQESLLQIEAAMQALSDQGSYVQVPLGSTVSCVQVSPVGESQRAGS